MQAYSGMAAEKTYCIYIFQSLLVFSFYSCVGDYFPNEFIISPKNFIFTENHFPTKWLLSSRKKKIQSSLQNIFVCHAGVFMYLKLLEFLVLQVFMYVYISPWIPFCFSFYLHLRIIYFLLTVSKSIPTTTHNHMPTREI